MQIIRWHSDGARLGFTSSAGVSSACRCVALASSVAQTGVPVCDRHATPPVHPTHHHPPAISMASKWDIDVIAALYAAAVFASGITVGGLRELLLSPTFGPRAGHLTGFALTAFVTLLLARNFVVPRVAGTLKVDKDGGGRVSTTMSGGGLLSSASPMVRVGLEGCLVMLLIEGGLALALLRTPSDKFLDRFNVYKGALIPWGFLLTALAPLWMAKASGEPTSATPVVIKREVTSATPVIKREGVPIKRDITAVAAPASAGPEPADVTAGAMSTKSD
eukprot:jgi/Mesvir1/25100/Mv21564-RA.1